VFPPLLVNTTRHYIIGKYGGSFFSFSFGANIAYMDYGVCAFLVVETSSKDKIAGGKEESSVYVARTSTK